MGKAAPGWANAICGKGLEVIGFSQYCLHKLPLLSDTGMAVLERYMLRLSVELQSPVRKHAPLFPGIRSCWENGGVPGHVWGGTLVAFEVFPDGGFGFKLANAHSEVL
uniref:Uncharacterized protein n=1 Tax=Candidatus Kentrum sp. LFY TaxID=2126342 RepID=A0A450WD86_9GAMM|nr:MAG: hypothetical protein BECKLFY1418C_GA0070996_101225 [Candidatus Kentron sp. LFY]